MLKIHMPKEEFTPHGYRIVKAGPWGHGGFGSKSSRMILAHMPYNNATPYVTWRQNRDDESCYWGEYYCDLDEGIDSFHNRNR